MSEPVDPRAEPVDPVLARRRQAARMAALGQRLGYALFGLAIAGFVVGFFAGLPAWLTTAVIVCLAAGSLLLAPAIILGYAVKAAEREDRGQPSGH